MAAALIGYGAGALALIASWVAWRSGSALAACFLLAAAQLVCCAALIRLVRRGDDA